MIDNKTIRLDPYSYDTSIIFFFCIRLYDSLGKLEKMANGREGKGENQLFSADL